MDRLWAMEVFVKVVEAGSLSGAATHLDLANASVTTCIRNLETHLGVTLLRRSTRHIGLTEEGAQYYDRCRDILALVETAEAAAAPSLTRLQGTLRLELPIAVGHLIIGPALVDFARLHLGLRIIVDLTNGIDNLIRRSVDVAIRMDEIDDADLVARRIYEARHVLCAAPSFLENIEVPNHPRDVDPRICFGFASMPAAKIQKWTFYKGDESHTIDPGGNLSFNSSDALLRSAARGAGYIYVLDVLAREYIQRNEVVTILQEWETARQTFYAVYPPSRYISPRIKLLVAFIVDRFKNL